MHVITWQSTELEHLAEKCQLLFDSARSPMIVSTASGEILQVNQSVVETFGFERVGLTMLASRSSNNVGHKNALTARPHKGEPLIVPFSLCFSDDRRSLKARVWDYYYASARQRMKPSFQRGGSAIHLLTTEEGVGTVEESHFDWMGLLAVPMVLSMQVIKEWAANGVGEDGGGKPSSYCFLCLSCC